MALIAVSWLWAAPAAAQQADPHAGHHMPAAPTAAASGTDQERTSPKGHLESAPPPASVILPPWVPEITDEMRRAAVPAPHGHEAHDRRTNAFVLFDRLEWQSGGAEGLAWGNRGWVGGDINRAWFRTEGEGGDDGVGEADVELLYGRAVHRWWDVVGGVRQDIRPDARTWLAVGVQGLAPYFFEVEATAYVSDGGRTAARFEVEYELLLTNRLILQPRGEITLFGKDDPEAGVGAGLSTGEIGMRLRYEFRREFAPYLGVSWVRAFGDTRQLDADAPAGAPRLVLGVRTWF
ncbi:copper resistance protein B [Luteitalea sp. TBR-22]|uniref:copper resistance protein B n=1 Tax=Luteitalea sp. TBR-22 TaxID=2802971 RepID=UPI001AFB1AF3|nr:copper resistance protein B [Luteitalea sp. TBR-22]BCS32341.1 copper resistance protein B [Luteitalea sp. TBR-22]